MGLIRRISARLARVSQKKKFIVLFWKKAGLHFKGRNIRFGCYFDVPSNVYIGENTFINYKNTFHTGTSGATIIIGDNCDIGPECMFMCSTHEMGDENQRASKKVLKSIVIGDGCWIGARSMILPGVSIGKGCVVAAGSVVTKSFPDNCLLGGVPSKIIKQL